MIKGDGEEEEDVLEEEAIATGVAGPTTVIGNSRSFQTTSLHPSVDSVIDPSPHSSMDNIRPSTNTFPPTASNDTTVEQVKAAPLTYTKKKLVNQHQHSSALSALIAEKATGPENPFAEYSFVSGKGESKSITLCVYLPHSDSPYTPISLVVRPDALTDDVIGYILYDYVEKKRKPELDEAAYDLSEWVILIAEDDGEIEDDLPAVDRTSNIGRVSFDQFALCRATPSQAKQNDIDRTRMGRSKPDLETLRKKKEATKATNENANVTAQLSENTIVTTASIPNEILETSPIVHGIPEENLSQTFTTHLMSAQPQNQPDASTVAVPVPSSKATLTKATMPMTPLKDFRIKLMTNEEVSATTSITVYAEMFIGDVLELVCRKRKLDPNGYMLTIADSNLIVSNDTTVESMKGITDLTLIKKAPTLSIPSCKFPFSY